MSSTKSNEKTIENYFTEENISALNALWDEIGLSEEEKKEEFENMIQKIEQVRCDFIVNSYQKITDMKRETQEIRELHANQLKALGESDDVIDDVESIDILGTVKDKYDDVNRKHQDFLRTYNERLHEFQRFHEQIQSCYESMGDQYYDPERREFEEIGDEDLTVKRLMKFEKKAKQLQVDFDTHFTLFNGLKKKTESLCNDLAESPPNDINELLYGHIYSDSVCEQLSDYITYLTEIYDTRKKYISEMAVEIVRLWDILDVDDDTRLRFINSHSVFSQKNVQDCIEEADRLTQIRDSRIVELIEKMKKEISEICDDLGYSEEQKQNIIEKCEKGIDQTHTEVKDMSFDKDSNSESQRIEEEEEEGKEEGENNNENVNRELNITKPEFEENIEETRNFIRIFNNYDIELCKLKKIHLVAHPIIDLINQRQEIIDEYNELVQQQKESQRIAENKKKEKEIEIDASKPVVEKDVTKSPKKKGKKKQQKKPKVVIRNMDATAKRFNSKIKRDTIRIRPPSTQERINAEKVTRRYKTILPRIEKKLLITLILFREENGEDFLWKGEPIINELRHIKVTQSEINSQCNKKNRRKNTTNYTNYKATENTNQQSAYTQNITNTETKPIET